MITLYIYLIVTYLIAIGIHLTMDKGDKKDLSIFAWLIIIFAPIAVPLLLGMILGEEGNTPVNRPEQNYL